MRSGVDRWMKGSWVGRGDVQGWVDSDDVMGKRWMDKGVPEGEWTDVMMRWVDRCEVGE